MLPLHTTFRNLFFASSLIFLASCTDRSNSDLKVINALNESIENSNKTVNASTTELIVSLEDKMHDYSTKERAMVWFPIAQRVQKISKDAFDQIQEIKIKNLNHQINSLDKDDVLKVYNCLLRYKDELLQIDSKLTQDYQAYLKIFTRRIDSLKDGQLEVVKDFFSGISANGAIAMLTKFQNNIKINEEGMVTFCHEYSTPMICGIRYLTAPIVIQNSTIVKPGDEIIITAGLGAFEAFMVPKIFIYNRLIQLDDDRAARYKSKVPSKPGKYYVPVKINYTDQDGRQQTVQKEIEYTVANIQKQ